MNDYERLAEKLTEAEGAVETAGTYAEDTDILDLVETAQEALAEARKLAEGRV